MNIPKHWKLSTLGAECTKPQYGWTASAKPTGSVKLLRTTDLTNGPLTWESVPFCSDVPEDVVKYRVEPDDIFISRAGSVGVSVHVKHIDAESPSVFASYLIRIRAKENLMPEFLAIFLQSPEYWQQIRDLSAGATMANINAPKIQSIVIPIPPLDEQCRIVEILDDHLSRFDKALADLESAELKIDSFRAAVFERCSGTSSPDIAYEWTKKTFGEVATIDSDLRPVKGLGHLPHIAPNNIQKGTGVLLDYKSVEDDGMQSAKNYFRPGQIIYSKIRPYLNKAVLVDFEGLCSADMYPISTSQNPRWLLFSMLSNSFVRKTSGSQNRTVLPKINANSLRQIELLVPTAQAQERLVAETDAYLEFIDGISTAVKKSQQLMESLKASFLHNAFSGQIEKVSK